MTNANALGGQMDILEVLATNTLANGFMASTTADGKAFYLRTKTHLYRVENLAAENK